MKRTKKLLILLCILAAVCGAAFGAARLNPEPDTDAEQDGSDVIFSVDPDSVTLLSFDYTDSISFDRDGDGWIYSADQSFPVNTARIDKMLGAVSGIEALKTIDEPEPLSQYGLDDPVCSVSLTADGSEYSFSIGNESAMGGGRYFSNGDGRVYLVDGSLLDSFSYGLYDMVKKELLPNMDDTISFTVNSGDKHYELDRIENSGLAYSDDYVWFYKDGEDYLTLDTALAKSFVSKITGLSWGECVNYKASEADLKSYGLVSPGVTVNVVYANTVEVETNMTDSGGEPIYDKQKSERSFTLEIGSYCDDKCYARISGSQMVYLIDGTVRDGLLHVTYESLQPDEVLSMDWDTVDSVDIHIGGGDYTFTKSGGNLSSGDGGSEAQNTWLLDGEEKELQPILDRLNGMIPSDSGSEKEPELGLQVRFTFHRSTESFRTVTLEFYDYDSGNCLVSLDGVSRLLVSRSDLSYLLNDLNALL